MYRYEEEQVVKITCTDNDNVADGVIIKEHPNGDKTILIGKSIKMLFKKHKGSIWTAEMLGREYVYDTRSS